MRLARFGPRRGREIDAYGSVGFVRSPLVATHGEARVDVVAVR
jgi:hypothetical protein